MYQLEREQQATVFLVVTDICPLNSTSSHPKYTITHRLFRLLLQIMEVSSRSLIIVCMSTRNPKCITLLQHFRITGTSNIHSRFMVPMLALHRRPMAPLQPSPIRRLSSSTLKCTTMLLSCPRQPQATMPSLRATSTLRGLRLLECHSQPLRATSSSTRDKVIRMLR
jgi:hypothetical protein